MQKPKRMCRVVVALLAIAAIAGCADALKRGMLGEAYVSTARPSITMQAKNMPLLVAGQGMPNLDWTGMAGGLPINVWLAVYGTGGLAPMAIVAQAQTPEGWYWDAVSAKPFSVDEGTAVFDGVGYLGCTYIVDPAADPFAGLVTSVQPDGQPQRWLARSYAARYNFNNDKIILEYREPLPPGITSLNELPFGHSDLLIGFAQRARDAFAVSAGPKNPQGVVSSFTNAIQWQLMSQNFLGSVSQYAKLNWN